MRIQAFLLAIAVLFYTAFLSAGPCRAAHGEWTWMSGSDVINQRGVYGNKGTPHADNVPGARNYCASSSDGSGILWLYGGVGYGRMHNVLGILNDLWRYDPVTTTWTWISGADTINQPGVYGLKGAPEYDNSPGARGGSMLIADSAGTLWLFGGSGIDGTGVRGYLNDLWRYEPADAMWVWQGGSDTVNQPGIYGEKGMPAIANMPGSRSNSAFWLDTAGNFWVFGGEGTDSAGIIGVMNDLWRYSPDEGLWTWVSGSDMVDQAGVYGRQGVSAAANMPGSRYGSMTWIDSAGNFWLFGGRGCDALYHGGTYTQLNDLWWYSPGEEMWTWVSGFNSGNRTGAYGDKGTPGADNVPGARYLGISWTDSSGDLVLFGGRGFDRFGYQKTMNDLWSYDPDSGMWTWLGGSDRTQEGGVYGEQGIPDSANAPGSRFSSIAWVDIDGNLWLFGGYGLAADFDMARLNDLWRYEPPGCRLSVRHKDIQAVTLRSHKKIALHIHGDKDFNVYGQIDLGPLTWKKVKFNRNKNRLKITAIVPAGLAPGSYPISVGGCAGEVVITGIER